MEKFSDLHRDNPAIQQWSGHTRAAFEMSQKAQELKKIAGSIAYQGERPGMYGPSGF